MDYPASSPYVVAVGGTTLFTNPNGTYASETGWTFSGGGVSGHEVAAQFEQQVSGINFLVRTVPDVAMDADPESGALIIVDGALNQQWGGTSLAAPLFAGSWARIQTANSFAFGFPNPLIYGLTVPMAPFHDITTGNNGDYSAGANWDQVTGWGSPMVASLSTAMASLPLAPTSIGASNNGFTCPTARLSWGAGVGATSYAIWREELAPVRAFVYTNGGTLTARFLVVNLSKGTSYSYKVGSCNATGCSAPSSVSTTLTQGACP